MDCIAVMVAQTALAEVGLDMSRCKTEAHFSCWLGLCPDNRITGGKVLATGTRRVVNRAATALRMAANALLRSQTYLGAQYGFCEANSVLRRPSQPWRTGSPDLCTEC